MKEFLFKHIGNIVIYSMICVGLLCFNSKYKAQKAEIERLSNNQASLLDDIDTFQTKLGKNAARIIELELTNGEFEKLCDEQAQTIKDLNLRVKYLQGITTTASSTDVRFKTVLKDSIIYHYKDSIVYTEKLKSFQWNDPWNRVDGVLKGDSVECSYQGVDTLNIVLTRVPKKFLFFKWGTKYIETTISHANPSTKIVYSKAIKIKNK